MRNEQIRAQQELSRWQAQRMEKHRQFQRGMARRRAAKQARQAKQVKGPGVIESYFQRGRPIGVFKSYITDKQKIEWTRKYNARAQLVEALNEAKKLSAVVGSKYGGKGKDILNTPEGKRLDSLINDTLRKFIKETSGATAAEPEVKRLQEIIRLPESWTTGSPIPAWDEMIDTQVREQNGENNIFLDTASLDSSGYRVEDEFLDPVLYGAGTNSEVVDAMRGEARRGISQDDVGPVDLSPKQRSAYARQLGDLSMGAEGYEERAAARDEFQGIGEELLGKVGGALRNRYTMMRDAGIDVGSSNAQTRANIAQAVTDNKIGGEQYNALMREQDIIEEYGPAAQEVANQRKKFGSIPDAVEEQAKSLGVATPLAPYLK
jgi:hypothetical protein